MRLISAIAVLATLGCNMEAPPIVLPVRSPVNVSLSRVYVDRTEGLAADGQDLVTVTVLVRDDAWKPLPGQPVEVRSEDAGVGIVQPLATDEEGIAKAFVTGSVAGKVALSAGVVTEAGLILLDQQAEVTFVAGAAGAGCEDDRGCLGQTCVRGACREACGTSPWGCGDGWACVAGACVPSTCAAVTCAAGTTCGGDGVCYPSSACTDVCGPFELCLAGRCIDKRCAGVSCDAGELCLFGECRAGVVALEGAEAGDKAGAVPQGLTGGSRFYTLKVAASSAVFIVRTASLSDFSGDVAVRLLHPTGVEIGFADYFADEETLAVFANPQGQTTPALRDLGLPAGTYAIEVVYKSGQPLFKVGAGAFPAIPDNPGAFLP